MLLPRLWLDTASAALPQIARDIVDRIRTEIPEYGRDRTGRVSDESRHAVREALDMFMDAMSAPSALAADAGPTDTATDRRRAEVFRRLGRLEARAGRSHDTLQSAYRIASEAVMHYLLNWEHEHDAPREVMAQLSAAVFGFIDELATLSAEGFAEEQAAQADDGGVRSRLMELLISRDGFARRAVTEAAERVPWLLPDTVTIVEVVLAGSVGDRPRRVSESVFGSAALWAPVGERWFVAAGGTVDPVQARARARRFGHDLLLVVGPAVPLVEAAASARLAQRLRTVHDVRARAVDHVVTCTENMIELLLDSGRDAVRVLAEDVLAPLAALTPVKRLRYGLLLSAWLEYGTLNADEPGVLDKHRQTLRYQCTQLEAMFGTTLRDRRARLELMIALRSVLPIWERQIEPKS